MDAVFFRGAEAGEFRCLSNFFVAPMKIGGLEYQTVEHYFQASKAIERKDHERIRRAKTPMQAKLLGRKLSPIRRDWERVKLDVMRTGLLEKFRQHPELLDILLSTGDLPIHEDSRTDSEWGWAGGKGKDLLGKALVSVRRELRRRQ